MSTETRKLRCIIIGAGVSGILIAIKLKEKLGDGVSFHVFEKNHDVGGCACDVPSHIYQYSFCPNPKWSRFYAPSSEIQSYLRAVTSHYGLRKHISFNSLVQNARWKDSNSVWHVDVDRKGVFECDVLISACGILNNIQWPQLHNLKLFEAKLCHTAAWDNSFDLRNKRVAIVGAGASAVQLLPAIQDEASHIDIYIRTPSWITTPLVVSPTGEANPPYSQEEKQRFADDATFSVAERKKMESWFNRYFRTFWRDSVEQQEIRARLEVSMRQTITKSEYRDKLIPKFDVGCRRINPGEAYLKALQRDHIIPVFDAIE